MKEYTTRYIICKLREQLDVALEYANEIEERLVEQEEKVIRQRIKKGGLIHKFKPKTK